MKYPHTSKAGQKVAGRAWDVVPLTQMPVLDSQRGPKHGAGFMGVIDPISASWEGMLVNDPYNRTAIFSAPKPAGHIEGAN